jgi:hypothetical protein
MPSSTWRQDYGEAIKGAAQECAVGSWIFQPRIKSQSMKNSSPTNVIDMNPRLVFGKRYGLKLSVTQPSPLITNITPRIHGM